MIREEMPHCAGPGRGWTARRRHRQWCRSRWSRWKWSPRACARGELDDQLVLLAPAAKGNEGKHGAGRSGRGGMRASSAASANAGAGAGLLLTSGGWWVGLGSKAAHRPRRRNTLKAVADEAGRGYTCGTSRGAGATYARNRAPAQPAPRSTCTASPYTRRPASRAQRDGVGGGCGRAAGQVSWGRVGSVGRFDRRWHTDGRPFLRGAHQRHGAAWAGRIGQRSLNAQGNATMSGAHS